MCRNNNRKPLGNWFSNSNRLKCKHPQTSEPYLNFVDLPVGSPQYWRKVGWDRHDIDRSNYGNRDCQEAVILATTYSIYILLAFYLHAVIFVGVITINLALSFDRSSSLVVWFYLDKLLLFLNNYARYCESSFKINYNFTSHSLRYCIFFFTFKFFSRKLPSVNFTGSQIPTQKLKRDSSFIELVKFSQRSDSHRNAHGFHR